MSMLSSKNRPFSALPPISDRDEGDPRRDGTINRLRDALITDKLAVMDFSGEGTGADPYNSGKHRTLDTKAAIWGKRPR
jgi:hypothetical protein